jgi:CRISPR-associated endonuclease/helicase Cas3
MREPIREWTGQAWGKLRATHDGEIEWHRLIDHCADVAACVEALLAQPTIAARFGLPPNDKMRVARLAALAFLHDLGKANVGFQNRRLQQIDGSVSVAGHTREIAPLFSDQLFDRMCATIPLDAMSCWGRDATMLRLLVASFSHHGTPIDVQRPDPQQRYGFPSLWQPAADGYDPFATIAAFGAALRRWFPAAFERSGEPLPGATEFQHAFAGLVMLADWLGSDTDFFPYSRPSDDERIVFARAQAGAAIDAVGIGVASRRVFVAAAPPSFTDLFPPILLANPMQEGAGRLDTGRLVVLEAEAGSGKTEAAIWRFKQLFEAGAVDGLYFALPTRIAATQIHGRVSRAVARLFREGDRPGVVLAVPGYVQIDGVQGRILPGFDVLWPDTPGEADAHRRWAAESPKRFLAAQIAVGTIDQALLSNLAVRHAHLRSTALLRHLLVIDEVHASDSYMTDLLASVLAVHVGAGGHALLMSATLGAAARRHLLLGRHVTPPAPAEAACVSYPSLSWADGQEEVMVPLAASGHFKRIDIATIGEIDDASAIARRALAAARAGAKVLVVRNTVRGAVAVQKALEASLGPAAADSLLLFRCEGVPTLHHGRFAREDRCLLDRAVEASIGRRGRPDDGVVVVGTQTLEQSLDIDADLLITDLCPIDVLLQRLGRLHRHRRENRPADFVEARCLVLTFADRDLSPSLRRGRHGLGPSHDFRGVYPDVRVIEATLRLLEEHRALDMPAMNRMLVEGATHPVVLNRLADDLGSTWRDHGDQVAGKRSADRSIAALHTIDRSVPFDQVRFPGLEERVQTRLGADSRMIDFADAGGGLPLGPFGQPVRMLTLSEHLCRGIPVDATAAVVKQDPNEVQFTFGNAAFLHGRHGLHRPNGR